MPPHSHSLKFLDDFDSETPAESYQAGVYKGLGCLIGMYLFFLIEKIVQAKQVNKVEKKPEGEIEELNQLMKDSHVIHDSFEFNQKSSSMNFRLFKEKPHSHGHSHGNKGEMLKSNAWMVILGINSPIDITINQILVIQRVKIKAMPYTILAMVLQ